MRDRCGANSLNILSCRLPICDADKHNTWTCGMCGQNHGDKQLRSPREYSLGFVAIEVFLQRCTEPLQKVSPVFVCAVIEEVSPTYASFSEVSCVPPVNSLRLLPSSYLSARVLAVVSANRFILLAQLQDGRKLVLTHTPHRNPRA